MLMYARLAIKITFAKPCGRATQNSDKELQEFFFKWPCKSKQGSLVTQPRPTADE